MKVSFTSIKTQGALLPPDILQRIARGDKDLGGLNPSEYHLPKGERLNEAINNSWNRVLWFWERFERSRENLDKSGTGTSETRENLLLPLFQELGYGRLFTARPRELEGKSYPVSHFWHRSPIHLVGCSVDLDKRAKGVRGAARSSPHALVQEFLNRSDDHLWGFLSNGLKLRILRDNASLSRQSFVEFDLETMCSGQIFSDFVLLWLLCHQSRVEAEQPGECWLEIWTQSARELGIRALDNLRVGVENAISVLGQGFLSHPGNSAIKARLRSGELDKDDYFRQLLRLIYRLLFLFAAEDRDLLLDQNASDKVRTRYARFYSTARLRTLAERTGGSRHHDLYQGLKIVMKKLGLRDGCPELGLQPLGTYLWLPTALPDLEEAEIDNASLLKAVRHLSVIEEDYVKRPVDYKNIGAQELGSVYESLLELHPELNVESGYFNLTTAPGHERKTTGSYYTPTSLISCLLDSALNPVIEEAARADEPDKAILNLTVCDPACGSGHFLIAAAHRLADRLARVRTGEDDPGPESVRTALRDVIGHCIYGVDINPMAVELCKVNLWLESMEPGKPLSFLENRIQCGNSLLGTTPALLQKGIPDEAFKPIEGDDPRVCKRARQENRERKGSQYQKKLNLVFYDKPLLQFGELAENVSRFNDIDDSDINGLIEKQKRYRELIQSETYIHGRFVADAWCAAFVWKKTEEFPYPITEEEFRKLENDPDSIPAWMRDEIMRLGSDYNFFHWHLSFPDIFEPAEDPEMAENRKTGLNGGFDVVLGNPPWERVKLQEKEWFAQKDPEIANAPNAAIRKQMIEELKENEPELHGQFLKDRRRSEGISHFLRDSGVYPLCGRGDVNTYSVFAEDMRNIINFRGKVGCIVPSGIATDDTTKVFFQKIMESRALVSLYDFENRRKIFPGIDSRIKFSLLTLTGPSRPARGGAWFAFSLLGIQDLKEKEKVFTLSAEDIFLINPNTRTCPIFRSQKDAELTKEVYKRVPVLIREGEPEENPWGLHFKAMFHMANDSHLFRTKQDLADHGFVLNGNVFENDEQNYLPLYEAKMIHHFDHRWATYDDSGNTRELSIEEKQDPACTALPRYWVPEWEVIKRGSRVSRELLKAYEEQDRDKLESILSADASFYQEDVLDLAEKEIRENCPEWFLGWRDITNVTNERTVISNVLRRSGVGHTCPLMIFEEKESMVSLLQTNLSTFVFDYTARNKIGGTHLTYNLLKQLPVLSAEEYNKHCLWTGMSGFLIKEFLRPRILELLYTNWELESFARDCGYNGPPFKWDPERRFLIRCEIDAAYFHLYSISRHDVEYIMDTFPIVRRKDENTYEEYRTKRVILEIYDHMAEAMETGKPYETRLDPPPGDQHNQHSLSRPAFR
ncbi:MAG: N-6 DNA methylase [Desulfobacteraceae bacterium]|nr:N-6 DNA methylase [Desulfobacteraceae bacterium]